ncbi:hypothetical protein Tco_1148482 [Tanacetum coccineum]
MKRVSKGYSRAITPFAPSTSQPPITPTEEAAPMPYESPLHSVHLLRRDEGNMQQHELMDLVTRLILRVKKWEKNVKTRKSRRRARIVISEDEDAVEDSSKQGRKISDIDTYSTISLVQPQQDMEYDFDATASIPVTTASASISTVSPPRVSTAEDISGAETLVYIKRSASKAKDKGKAIMQESEPLKKIKKRVQVQISIDEELAKKVFEEEQAKFKAENEQEKFDFETTLELQKKLDEREEVAEHVHVSEESRWIQMSHFKGMSYEEIRPIFERVWDQIESFVPMDSKKEKGSEKKTRGRRKKSLTRKSARETLSEESAKKQKLEDDAEKEELQVYLNIVPEEESFNIESLATKYPIVDWETQILANDKYYYQVKRANGSVKHYKIFSAMLYDFDRQDVLELYKLVKDRFQTASPEDQGLGSTIRIIMSSMSLRERERESSVNLLQIDFVLTSYIVLQGDYAQIGPHNFVKRLLRHQLPLSLTPSNSQPPITPTGEPASMPYESPLHSVHSFGPIGTRAKQKVKTEAKARRRAGLLFLERKKILQRSFKQGRKISDIDTDPTISLVQPQQDMEYDFDVYECIKTKDKGKAIMQESEPPKKIKKRVQYSNDIDEELLRSNLDERKEVVAKEAHDIDWSDPSVLRYHALQNRSFSVAEVRKNMCMDLKNQVEEIVQQDDVITEQVVKESSKTARGRRKKSLARKRAKETLSEETTKKQKLENDNEKEQLQVYLNIVPEEDNLNIESLATKQDVLELYKLVKERFQTTILEGYDLLLWSSCDFNEYWFSDSYDGEKEVSAVTRYSVKDVE